jgi:hypothetical protein
MWTGSPTVHARPKNAASVRMNTMTAPMAEANILPAYNLNSFGPEGDRMHMILNF